MQYLADQNPASGLCRPPARMERYRVQEWLNFVALGTAQVLRPDFPADDARRLQDDHRKENLGKRFDWLDKQLAGKQYLMGDKFTVADAYMFTVLAGRRASRSTSAEWPNVKAYVDRVAARPKVQEALKAEGLVQ